MALPPMPTLRSPGARARSLMAHKSIISKELPGQGSSAPLRPRQLPPLALAPEKPRSSSPIRAKSQLAAASALSNHPPLGNPGNPRPLNSGTTSRAF
ncbi:hypothetical protein GL50803_005778 [Giardia duodenalis]|uniref:Uncharacterized protein n=1 Tax=Giardia intestinalis (strain ATCC 50803 / WB clone C6) TaxID=184922 RepID=D3KG07_GIAIC|nr:hypothetical protein GL50803_005778 [Giardia intestinalis]KAE8302997.1 hypothetical protein GL50803_005778 [Giardia intestinalis]